MAVSTSDIVPVYLDFTNKYSELSLTMSYTPGR